MTGITDMVDIQASVNVKATADWTDVISNLITLYSDPWFVMSILMTFGVGMLAYLMIKAYQSNPFWVTTLLTVTTVEVFFGYILTWAIVNHPEVNRYALITGANAAFLYWVVDYFSAKFKLVRVQAFLHFKKVVKSEDGTLKLGGPISFRRSGSKC